MLNQEFQKKWYQKKRYYIPLGIIGILAIVGLFQPNNINQQQIQNTQTQQGQVKSDTITIPAYIQPLQIKQEQPQNPQVNNPQPTQQPNYYINNSGTKVQSPTKYDSRPAGASARCRDGTYSFSQNRRGTCSHHGGVADWY